MEIKFIEDVDTMKYGKIKKNAIVPVSDEDGQAFIKNGKAVAVNGASSKKGKEDK